MIRWVSVSSICSSTLWRDSNEVYVKSCLPDSIQTNHKVFMYIPNLDYTASIRVCWKSQDFPIKWGNDELYAILRKKLSLYTSGSHDYRSDHEHISRQNHQPLSPFELAAPNQPPPTPVTMQQKKKIGTHSENPKAYIIISVNLPQILFFINVQLFNLLPQILFLFSLFNLHQIFFFLCSTYQYNIVRRYIQYLIPDLINSAHEKGPVDFTVSNYPLVLAAWIKQIMVYVLTKL